MHFQGKLFRALNPIHAREPLSGRGAAIHGGRFNPRGRPALYASVSVATALRQANQIGNLQPTTLVCYDADIEAVADCRDEALLAEHAMEKARLADPSWRDQMRMAGEAATQTFACRLMASGFNAMLVPSFAPGTTDRDLNLVLWRWSDGPPARLTLIDDEGRLS